MIFFFSAIDTDCGKSLVIGSLARFLQEKGRSVITQKLVQTGCVGFSEDINTHREMMQSPLLSEDFEGLTCPYLFSFPASPHLSAEMEQRTIDTDRIREATRVLQGRYECVLLEGVGGLLVPLSADTTVLDYVAGEGYPLVLVTSGRLGSINHTLLSLRACLQAGVQVKALVFNRHPLSHAFIAQDALTYFKRALSTMYPEAVLVDFPLLAGDLGELPVQECWEDFYERSCAR